MKKWCFLAAMVCILQSAFAVNGYLAQNVEIVEIGNTSGNGDNFYIKVIAPSGGSIDAVCLPLEYIEFNRNQAVNDHYFNRAYATALSAMTLGMRVDIFRYAGGPSMTAHCKEAQQIVMKR